MVIVCFLCSSNVLSPCSAFIEPIYKYGVRQMCVGRFFFDCGFSWKTSSIIHSPLSLRWLIVVLCSWGSHLQLLCKFKKSTVWKKQDVCWTYLLWLWLLSTRRKTSSIIHSGLSLSSEIDDNSCVHDSFMWLAWFGAPGSRWQCDRDCWYGGRGGWTGWLQGSWLIWFLGLLEWSHEAIASPAYRWIMSIARSRLCIQVAALSESLLIGLAPGTSTSIREGCVPVES